MSAQRDVTRMRREDLEFDLDAEQEVDVRRYWSPIAAHWWLPLAGLALGLALGYALAVGGRDVYKAEATIYLGQPFSPTAQAPVPALGTNPTIVNQIVHSEAALRAVSRQSGLPLGRLRNGVSSKAISGGRRLAVGQNPLVEISVKGRPRRAVQLAANAMAARVINDVSPYVDVKIDSLNAQLKAQEAQLDSLVAQVDAATRAVAEARNLPPLDQLPLVTLLSNVQERRSVLEQDREETRALIALAERVEKAQLVERAIAVETTARSTRNSMIVGGLLGLLAGALAALLWEPVTRRVRS
jgi:uncharacterized protein involved in exopolysaccharide biosynthesis